MTKTTGIYSKSLSLQEYTTASSCSLSSAFSCSLFCPPRFCHWVVFKPLGPVCLPSLFGLSGSRPLSLHLLLERLNNHCKRLNQQGHLFVTGRITGAGEIPGNTFLCLHREIHQNSENFRQARLQMMLNLTYNPIGSVVASLSQVASAHMPWSPLYFVVIQKYIKTTKNPTKRCLLDFKFYRTAPITPLGLPWSQSHIAWAMGIRPLVCGSNPTRRSHSPIADRRHRHITLWTACNPSGITPLIYCDAIVTVAYRCVSGPLVSPSLGNLWCDSVIEVVDLRARSTVHVVSPITVAFPLGPSPIHSSDAISPNPSMRSADLIWSVDRSDSTAPVQRYFNLRFTWVSAIL